MTEMLNVVIAEDDDGHATLVRRHLRRAGLEADPVHVHDGQDALDYMYRRNRWAGRHLHDRLAMVIDLNMPRLNGFDVLRLLKGDPALSRIPVFVLTTTDNAAELDRCYALGAAACIVKPVDAAAFSDAMHHLAQFLMTVRLPGEQGPS